MVDNVWNLPRRMVSKNDSASVTLVLVDDVGEMVASEERVETDVGEMVASEERVETDVGEMVASEERVETGVGEMVGTKTE